jgi:hypothetical protein
MARAKAAEHVNEGLLAASSGRQTAPVEWIEFLDGPSGLVTGETVSISGALHDCRDAVASAIGWLTPELIVISAFTQPL